MMWVIGGKHFQSHLNSLKFSDPFFFLTYLITLNILPLGVKPFLPWFKYSQCLTSLI